MKEKNNEQVDKTDEAQGEQSRSDGAVQYKHQDDDSNCSMSYGSLSC